MYDQAMNTAAVSNRTRISPLDNAAISGARAPEICEQIQKLTAVTVAIQERTEELEVRFGGVLAPSTPSPTTAEDQGERVPMAPLARELAELRERLDRVYRRLFDVIRRAEL